MDQITHDARSTHWLNIIAECQNRPEGITAKEWLTNNGIKVKAYYYWLRKFRKQAYTEQKQSLTVPDSGNEISFAEVNFPVRDTAANIVSSNPVQPVAVIQCAGGSIAVTNEISEKMLSLILQEVLHA